jgi:dihydroorotase
MHDLVFQAGRVVCPRTGRDGPGEVGVDGDRIAAVGENLEGAKRIELPDAILLPGLIDLHAHPGCGGMVFYAVEPDEHMMPNGVTTVLSQGDAGADNFTAYLDSTIRSSRTRVLMALNLSRKGELARGAFANPDDADIVACVATATAHPEHIWGISVNTSRNACGDTDPRLIAQRGVEAAERAGLPLLFGMRCPEDWPLAEQLELLRPGDVVTYCFRRHPHCIVDFKKRTVFPAICEARGRGVLFDVGHGMGSFDFEVAEIAIADGFPPDTISTDQQRRHLETQTEHSLPHVMAKLQAAGMPEPEIFKATTSRPAEILRLETELGTLTPGACADLVAFKKVGKCRLTDVEGAERPGPRWEVALVMRAGRLSLDD